MKTYKGNTIIKNDAKVVIKIAKCLYMIIIVVCTMGALVSCKKNNAEKDEKRKCIETVETFLNLYQKMREEVGDYVYDFGEQKMDYGEMQKVFSSKLSFEPIKDFNKSDNGGIVNVTIENIDFKKAYESLEQTTENIDIQSLIKALSDESVPMRKYNVDVRVVSTENGYKLVMDGEISNALYGGYVEYIQSLLYEEVIDEE